MDITLAFSAPKKNDITNEGYVFLIFSKPNLRGRNDVRTCSHVTEGVLLSFYVENHLQSFENDLHLYPFLKKAVESKNEDILDMIMLGRKKEAEGASPSWELLSIASSLNDLDFFKKVCSRRMLALS